MPHGACGFVPYRQVRLFRNDGRFAYRGRVFEELVRIGEGGAGDNRYVTTNGNANDAASDVDAVDTGVVVHHFGRLEPEGRIYRAMCAYLDSAPEQSTVNDRNVHYAFETAVQLFVLDRLAEARMLVTRCLEIAPEAWQCLNLRGLIDLRTGMTREAIDCFRRALHLDEEIVDLHHNLGAALMESEEHAQALVHFERCIALGGEDARVLELAAKASMACGRIDGATRYVRRTLAADPHRPGARVLMAEIRFADGDRPGALDALETLRFIPGIRQSVWMRSLRLLVAMDEYEEAERFADRAVLEHPDSNTLCLVRGHILELGGKDSGAIAAYRRLLERDPDNPLVLLRLGCLCERRGDLEDALRSMRNAHILAPRDNRVQVNLAIVLQRLGRNDEAERHLRAAMERGADDGVACNALGCVLANSGRYVESILYFQRAVSLEPANESFRMNLLQANRRLKAPVSVS
jgi:Tfp pilus assembly protein PilF